ncbi:MAG TPA: hypothetical protein VJT78_06690 [Candidatus Dormibacteraeota bacterium]|nr:hypothetical protein [Candidatus Dormibacteraeota bacterium]
MSKRITVPWYIAAWVVWLIAFVAYLMMVRSAGGTVGNGTTAGIVIASIVSFIAAIVTLVMWIGALVKLGTQRTWGWFIAVLVLHLVGLGIIGMIAYGIAGPADHGMGVVTRPTTAG